MCRAHRELTAEMVVDGRGPSAPALSPDGRWIAYLVAAAGMAGEHPHSELWITPTDGHQPPRPLDIPPAHLSIPRWTSDSRSLLFRSDRSEPGMDRLNRIDPFGDSVVRPLPGPSSAVLDHHPLDGPYLVAFLAVDEPTEEQLRRRRDRDDAEVRGRSQPARLRLLDSVTGQIHTPATFDDRHVIEVAPHPDGGPLAVLTWSAPEIDPGLVEPALHLLDPCTGVVTDLGRTPAGANSPVWWHAEDGWHLAYLALTPPALHAGNAVFDVAVPDPGPVHPHRNLTAELAACPIELVQADLGTPLVLVADGLDTTIHRLAPDGGLVEMFRADGPIEQLSTNRDGTVIAAITSGPTEPAAVSAGSIGGPLARRTDTRPELRDVAWGNQERLSYRASDGLALDGLLVLPNGQDQADGPFPLVTLVHGGPYDRHADGFALSWAMPAQWLTQAGYAVFLPNPRGGLGHGHEFASRVVGAVGQDEWTDILTGIDLLIADGVADPQRLGIGGWSHGGFMAAWAVGQTNRFAAAMMGAGISDWGTQAGAGEWGTFETALTGSIGWEGPGPHAHDRLSPISYASAIRTPILIMHGAEDTNVPTFQAEYLHRALRRFGVEHEYVVYPRENHSFRERNHQIDVLRRTRAWFDRWLTAPAESE